MCGVRTYLNLSNQIISEKTLYLGTSSTRNRVGLLHAADISRAIICISGFCADAVTVSVLQVFRPLVRAASTRSTEILSICSVILGV